MPEPDELLTVGQAADVPGCHRVTVDQMLKDGRLQAVTLPPAYRRSGKWRYIRRSDVERLAATYTPKPGRQPGVLNKEDRSK
jgi:excisionase family DNA binding protein